MLSGSHTRDGLREDGASFFCRGPLLTPLLFLSAFLLFSSPVSAEVPAPLPSVPDGTTPIPGSDLQTKPFPAFDIFTLPSAEITTTPEERTVGDAIQAGISKSILASSMWLDSFFYDPRYAAEENRTRAIVRLEAFLEEDAHWDLRTRVQLKLVLPQLKNKAHLVVAGDPDEQTEEQAEAGVTAPPRPEANKERNVSSSLGYFFRSTDRVNISARVGVRYRHGDVVVFVRPHYRVLYDINGWALRLTQEIPYWTDAGWASLTAVDLEREFTNKFFLRTSLVGNWYEDVNGYFYSAVFSLRQPLSPRRALQYEWTNSFQTRPNNRLMEVLLAVRFRQRLWRDWLYYEIVPQARFPRERPEVQNFHEFDLVPGIMFRIEMFFGKL